MIRKTNSFDNAAESKRFSFGDLYETTKGRDVYIWGAGHYGVGLYRKCKEYGIAVKGFIDKNPLLENTVMEELTIFGLAVLEKYEEKKPFLLLAATGSINQLEEYCILHGFKKNIDFYFTKDIPEYLVDIVGRCNLRCPSCPRGNSPHNSIRGMMDVELFKKIIDKIMLETPDLVSLMLYNWGEPFLHPSLPELIAYVKTKNISVGLSSNMSIEKNIDKALMANPDWLKISLSGYYQNVYATTHTGGNINLVKSNMYRIRYLIDKYKLTTKVSIGYHKYLNNLGKDLEKMQELCNELGFILTDMNAFYMPIERIIDNYEQKTVKHLKELSPLFINTDVYKIKSAPTKTLCKYLNQILIDCNGKIQLCCMTYDDINNFDMDYLSISLQDIVKIKKTHDFCNKCKAYGLAGL
jgi:MoaA/NifB/PqqE/SkfB family radical SAM enzyme